MSYSFSNNTHWIQGTLATTRRTETANPYTGITVSAWIHLPSGYTAGGDTVVQLASSDSSDAESWLIAHTTTAGRWRAIGYSAALAVNDAVLDRTGGELTEDWMLLVAVLGTADTARSLYYPQTSQNTDDATVSVQINDLLHVVIGNRVQHSDGWFGVSPGALIAEVGIWDTVLSSEQIAALETTKPSGVAASNLIGYWPLDTNNSTQANEGTDTGGDLTVTGASYSTTHPTLSDGLTKYLKLSTAPGTGADEKIYMTWAPAE